MFCPDCRSGYRAGFTLCADCGSVLVPRLPSRPLSATTPDPASLVEVFRASTPFEADVVISILRGEGIEAMPRTELPGGMVFSLAERPVVPGEQYVVLVSAGALAKASDVLAAMAPQRPVECPPSSAEPIGPPALLVPSRKKLLAALLLASLGLLLLHELYAAIRAFSR